MILAIDLGGTKVELAILDHDLHIETVEQYPSEKYPSLEPIVEAFLKKNPVSIKAVGVGVAGPVESEQAQVTNLPWQVTTSSLTQLVGTDQVFLLNDLQALALGCCDLQRGIDTVILNQGKQQLGNKAVIAAGTGLGEAILHWDGQQYLASPSEGGNGTFAPSTQTDIELMQFLLRSQKHVSWEDVVSGHFGFRNLYEFFQDKSESEKISSLEECKKTLKFPALLVAAANRGEQLAEQVMTTFIRLYGSEAGNLALTSLATGGVYVGGGIAPKIIDRMQDGSFAQAFFAKGRFSSLLKDIPLDVITNPHCALKGAGAFAKNAAALAKNRKT